MKKTSWSNIQFRQLRPSERLVRDRDGRLLEVIFDGFGALVVNEGEVSMQSVVLTHRELRWLAIRAPWIVLRAWRRKA